MRHPCDLCNGQATQVISTHNQTLDMDRVTRVQLCDPCATEYAAHREGRREGHGNIIQHYYLPGVKADVAVFVEPVERPA